MIQHAGFPGEFRGQGPCVVWLLAILSVEEKRKEQKQKILVSEGWAKAEREEERSKQWLTNWMTAFLPWCDNHHTNMQRFVSLQCVYNILTNIVRTSNSLCCSSSPSPKLPRTNPKYQVVSVCTAACADREPGVWFVRLVWVPATSLFAISLAARSRCLMSLPPCTTAIMFCCNN